MKKDIKRLATEWLQHDKIVLAVDFDDTLKPWVHSTEEECDKVMKLVKWVQTVGAHIMIHTASDPSRYNEIINYCTSKGLVIDSINTNPIKLPYGTLGKPYYNWQLCDRSGLTYATSVLEQAAKKVLTQKRNNNSLNEID